MPLPFSDGGTEVLGVQAPAVKQSLKNTPVCNWMPAGVNPIGERLLAELGGGVHISRLLTGGGVDVEVLQEDLRRSG